MKKIGFAIGGVLGVWGLLLICVKSYASQYTFQALKRAPIVPVGIIFGAGYKQNGEPSKYLKDRLDTGIALFRAGKIKKLLLSGDNGRASHDELGVMKRYFKARNLDSTKVFVDYAGLTPTLPFIGQNTCLKSTKRSWFLRITTWTERFSRAGYWTSTAMASRPTKGIIKDTGRISYESRRLSSMLLLS